jgi:hypothetical protein
MLRHTPVLDEVIDVPTDAGPITRCRLRVFRGAAADLVAVVSELAANEGPSVTNAAEHIWRDLTRRLDTVRFAMVEHYDIGSGAAAGGEETFDLVTVSGGKPTWQPLGAEGLRRLVAAG